MTNPKPADASQHGEWIETLLYTSFATQEFSVRDLKFLLDKARQFNKSHGVTGLLIYRDRVFLQYLEGLSSDITIVYDRIKRDNRHEELVPIMQGKIQSRLFPEWDMNYVPSKRLNPDWINILFAHKRKLRGETKTADELLEALEHIRLAALEYDDPLE